MSYSFSVSGASKADVLKKVGEELDKVVAAQPMHSHDREQAMAAAEAFVELLPEKADHEVHFSMHGSVGWSQGSGEGENEITGAGVGVSASLQAAPKSA